MALLPLSKWNMRHKDSLHSSHLYTVYLELAENSKSHSEIVFNSFHFNTVFLRNAKKYAIAWIFLKKKKKSLAHICVSISAESSCFWGSVSGKAVKPKELQRPEMGIWYGGMSYSFHWFPLWVSCMQCSQAIILCMQLLNVYAHLFAPSLFFS